MTEDAASIASAEERAAALERRIAEIEAATNARLIKAELKAEAIRAGMVDLDGIKLIDSSALKLGVNGEIEGLSDLMTKLRRTKPWLFGGASSSSSAAPPPSQPPAARSARDMNHDEWQKARAELLKRR